MIRSVLHDRLRRFEQEARAASALNHPNIVVVHDVGSEGGTAYVVSELLEGQTLRERLSTGALPESKAITYGVQIASALAAAHDKGIVHRDLKPENIFVMRDGSVKILDFGLAKLTHREEPDGSPSDVSTNTEPGVVMGTVGYMSPEQVMGIPADARSDLFAFGVILYEMLTGRRAFSGASAAETSSAILRDEPPPLSPESAPSRLERVIRRCLEKSPGERFQSARDLAFALGESSSSSIAGGAARPTAPVRRPRLAVVVGLLVVAVAVVVGINSGRFRERLMGAWGAGGAGGATGIRSLAVLPLQNLSGDPGHEYFADGMTDALTASLAQIRSVRVISRTSAMLYKGSKKPLREIARDLHVDAVVEGSFVRFGDRVRITAQLIRGQNDAHFWAKSFERQLGDALYPAGRDRPRHRGADRG